MTDKLSRKVWLIAGIVLLALGASACLLLGGLAGVSAWGCWRAGERRCGGARGD